MNAMEAKDIIKRMNKGDPTPIQFEALEVAYAALDAKALVLPTFMNEFVAEWTKDRDYAGISVPSGTAWKAKLLQYAKAYPDKVKVIAINDDGSAFFHVPKNWVKCSPPKKVSEGQRAALSERSRKMWEDRKREDSCNLEDSERG